MTRSRRCSPTTTGHELGPRRDGTEDMSNETKDRAAADRRRALIEQRLKGQAVKTGANEIRPAARSGTFRLSYGQERLWFLDHLQPGSVEYLEPLVLRVRGKLDERVLGRALDEL